MKKLHRRRYKMKDIKFNFLNKYFDDKKLLNIFVGESGYNNTTRYIETHDCKFVLRIYETHKDESKVKFEHEVLLKLNQIKDLPFFIPKPLYTKERESYVRLTDGSDKIACIYYYINGINPHNLKEESLESYGKSTGYLLKALKSLDIKEQVVYRPYYEIEHSHPTCPIDKVVKWCSTPSDEFHNERTILARISDQLIQFDKFVPYLKELPHQLIHGDLNESNILMNFNGTLQAILDFEFVTNDLRIMEAAVCISELIIQEPNEEILWNKISTYIRGITSVIVFTEDEINVLPILIQLRRLDVFLHFLGRYIDGLDDATVLKEQINKADINLNWINYKGERLIDCWNSISNKKDK
jgi:homoserine kinase type II